MWFWNIIKGVLYNFFVDIWVIGLIIVTLLVFFGISLFTSLKVQSYKSIGFYVSLIFAVAIIAAAIYILYWYFANDHFIIGSVALLVSLAVIYITCIEPYLKD